MVGLGTDQRLSLAQNPILLAGQIAILPGGGVGVIPVDPKGVVPKSTTFRRRFSSCGKSAAASALGETRKER